MRAHRLPVALAALMVFVASEGLARAQGQAAATAVDARSPFAGRETEIERCLGTARIVKQSSLSIGVTRPGRLWFEPCEGVASAAWKTIRPGTYRGFWESYKSEIAAYELDRLLRLGMVPPTVERKVNGINGAVIMWLDNMRMWKDLEGNKPTTARWNAQMVQMKMFDALIGNVDRNGGNALIDEHWDVYLIDHSRAFVTSPVPPVKFLHVDPALWARMRALDEDSLTETIGRWIDRRAVTALLARRDRMTKEINKLVAEKGAERVFIQY